jgi:tetratricopeptide (TPR) repeat protein
MNTIVQNPKILIYREYLKEINNIEFTYREIDVMACMLHNRGEKKIASILSISPRTVSVHVRNIALKISGNSRENIIDFIENSGRIPKIKKYYLFILAQNLFHNSLSKISHKLLEQKILIHFDIENIDSVNMTALKELSQDLSLAGIILDFGTNNKQNYDFEIKLLGRDRYFQNSQENLWIKLSPEQGEAHNDISATDLSSEANYYKSVFCIISKVLDPHLLAPIREEFTEKYQAIFDNFGLSSTVIQNRPLDHMTADKKIQFFIVAAIAVTSVVVIFILYQLSVFGLNKENGIRSSLPLPHKSILLDRSDIMDEISSKCSKKDTINTAVLLGAGGLGKTTIARKFAKKSNAPVIWEINCETTDSILSSFEQLAYFLSQNPEERNELLNINKNQNQDEKKNKLVFFLSQRIKKHEKWTIIYDNLKSFHDIEAYFQYDSQIWGNGDIIITTTDENITNNIYINPNNVIHVDSLSNKEKLYLFKSILSDSSILETNAENIEEFLENIPPFPLDVSLTAYYIRENNISMNQYLSELTLNRKHLFSEQKNILQNIGNYTNTRYDIVRLSITNIMKSDKDFTNLLFATCLLNSHNIPKELLYSYSSKEVADEFLRELKRFSLITYDNKSNHSYFSIHRNTKAIILEYLLNEYYSDESVLQTTINGIAHALVLCSENEIKKYDIPILRPLILHIETFLNHSKGVSELCLADLYKQLGVCYFNIGIYNKAEDSLAKSIEKYHKIYGQTHVQSASAAARLAGVYRNIGNSFKAKELLESAAAIYQKTYGSDNIHYAWILVYLGSIYENIGNYDIAEQNIKQALKIYQEYYGVKDHIKISWASSYLGEIYTSMGKYHDAIKILEKSLKAYQAYYKEDNTKIAWLSVKLGSAYSKIGEHYKALGLFESSLLTYQKQYGDSCLEAAWCYIHIGKTYSDIGKLDKAREAMDIGLKIYSNYFTYDHIIVAWAKFYSGCLYIKSGDNEKAGQNLSNAQSVYSMHYGPNHPKTLGVISAINNLKQQE